MLTATPPNDAAAQDRFRLAMASSALGMAILDLDGRWHDVNPALADMLGRPMTQLLGQDIARFTPDNAGLARESVDALVRGVVDTLAVEIDFLRADGAVLHAHLDIAAMRDAAGRALSLVAHVGGLGAHGANAHDVKGNEVKGNDVSENNVNTRQDALQTENAALQRALADANRALAAMNQLHEAFAHGVSHDLRAPLRVIDSFSTRLATRLGETPDAGAAAREDLGRIRDATTRMSTLIDALLGWSRAMRAELHTGEVDLSLLADWALAERIDADPERVAELSVQPGLTAFGDERLLKQMMDALLHNAWMFSADRVCIEVSGERHDGRIVLAIRDHGCGFDMRYAGKLFVPFQRLHGPEHAGGSGLGLATVQGIVERHGGRAWAQSELGAGSTFFIELPTVANLENRA